MVFVRFISDMNTNGRGFELKFSASKCIHNLTAFIRNIFQPIFFLDCNREIRDLQGAIGK